MPQLIKFGAHKANSGWIGYFAISWGIKKAYVRLESSHQTRERALAEAKQKALYYSVHGDRNEASL